MKNINYTKPEIEIVLFENEDIMTASNVSFGDEDILNGEKQDWIWQ